MTEPAPFSPQSQYDKAELVACGLGELFGPGNAQLPVDNMLMVDRISHISSEGGAADKGELIAELDRGADIALGSRYIDRNQPRSSLARRVGTRLFSWIASRWIGQRITDPTSGFQGLSRRALESVVNDGFPEDYPDCDVLVQHHRRGLIVREVPVVMHERVGGLSMHRGARIAYYGYKMFLTLLLMPVRRATPLRAADTVARAS